MEKADMPGVSMPGCETRRTFSQALSALPAYLGGVVTFPTKVWVTRTIQSAVGDMTSKQRGGTSAHEKNRSGKGGCRDTKPDQARPGDFRSDRSDRSTVADLFYGRLFEIAPHVRPMFPEDRTEQKEQLMVMLGTAVAGLGHRDTLLPTVSVLDRRMPATA